MRHTEGWNGKWNTKVRKTETKNNGERERDDHKLIQIEEEGGLQTNINRKVITIVMKQTWGLKQIMEKLETAFHDCLSFKTV